MTFSDATVNQFTSTTFLFGFFGVFLDSDFGLTDAMLFLMNNEQETETWINSRTTGANKIMVNNEIENFLFYSAIGNLTIPFQFNFSNNKELKIINSGEIDIPYFCLAYDAVCGKWITYLFLVMFISSVFFHMR